VAFALVLAAGGLALVRSSWYQRRLWEHQPLAVLQQEADAHRNDPAFLYLLGRRLNESKRFDEAAPMLERAAGLDPDGAPQREEWARALLGVGHVSDAFIELRQYVGTHPRSGPGHLALGKFYTLQRALERAEDECATATQLMPESGEAWSFLAAARSSLNNPVGALPAAEKAVALRPNNAGDRLLLASIEGRLGRNSEARAAYEAACRLGPTRADTHREYAQWLLDHPAGPDDSGLAEAEARRSIALDDRNAKAQLILGRILLQQRRDADALAPLERAVAINPINPAPLLALKQACHRLGRTEEERRWSREYLLCQQQNALNTHLQDEIARTPTAPAPHRQLARLMAEWGDINECLKHEGAALRCPPDAPPALVAAGRDLLAVGRPEDALPLANQALAAAPNDLASHELRGDALLKLGQPHMAAVEYDAAATIQPDREAEYRARLAAYFASLRKVRQANPKTGNASGAELSRPAAGQGR
jgi:tetratricopeptide (TPR) repeat protein